MAVQLLDELEHHSIASAFPHVTVGAEALCPSSLASLDAAMIVSWARKAVNEFIIPHSPREEQQQVLRALLE